MAEIEAPFIEVNSNLAQFTVLTGSLLQLAAQNGGNEFNIFITSLERKYIPKKEP